MRPNKLHTPDASAMERLLQSNRSTAVGIILRLAWREGLTRDEIGKLTWEQVDFDAMRLCLPDRAVPLEEETAACLRERAAVCGERGPYW